MGRRAIVLLVALILAGLAAWAIWNFLQNVQREAEAGQEVVTVFRAGPGGIAEGQEGSIILSSFQADVRCQDPELDLASAGTCPIKESTDQLQDVPTDVLDSEDKLNQILTGRVAAGPISPGQIITESQWVQLSVAIKPLAEQIPSGKQALTVSTSNVQGVNGFVEAGDRINLIITLDIAFDQLPVESDGVTLPPDTGTEGEPTAEQTVVTYTRYVLQGIPVLAVGRNIRAEDTEDQTGQVPADAGDGTTAEGEEPVEEINETVFTLEVTPEQAERIVYAFENGSMWLTLVPPDFVEVETNGVVIDNLFGGDLVDQIFGS
ncbi:MAG: Flp pilus assembly protein CpaB [Actinobacteria bacterium]|nr:Flp pilus assembly protein CpaB [Actinomycetota bacterium]